MVSKKKFGRLLAGKFKAKQKSRSKSKRPKKVSRPNSIFISLKFKKKKRFLASAVIKSRKPPVIKKTAVLVESLPNQNETPVVTPVALPDIKSAFSIQDLIRPKAEVQKSLEGFFMNQRSVHTRNAYAKDFKRFVKYLIVLRERKSPDVPLDRTVIISYKEWLVSEGLQQTTVDRHLATLKSLFGWLAEDDLIDKSPAEKVRRFQPKKFSSTSAFTDEEVRKILGLPNIHARTGAQHYAILMVLFYCGLRRSEICSLKLSSIGNERNQMVLKLLGKGNVERLIPLIPAVWHAIKYYLILAKRTGSPEKGLAKDEFLFRAIVNNRTKEFKKPLDPSMIYYIVKKYAKLAKIQRRVSPHSCRATAISNARDHNVSDRAIQEFAGWADPQMITHYDKRKTAIKNSAAHAISYRDSASAKPAGSTKAVDL